MLQLSYELLLRGAGLPQYEFISQEAEELVLEVFTDVIYDVLQGDVTLEQALEQICTQLQDPLLNVIVQNYAEEIENADGPVSGEVVSETELNEALVELMTRKGWTVAELEQAVNSGDINLYTSKDETVTLVEK